MSQSKQPTTEQDKLTLAEMLSEIDDLLISLEDTLHGEDGKIVSKARSIVYKLQYGYYKPFKQHLYRPVELSDRQVHDMHYEFISISIVDTDSMNELRKNLEKIINEPKK